jgi:hypothetical protein
MNRILNLINIIKGFSSVDNFSKIGLVKKQIGNQYFLSPIDSDFQAISILKLNNKIQKVGIQLSNEIDLVEIEKFFNKKAEHRHSLYDGLMYFSFLEKNFKVSFVSRNTSKEQSSFKELEIVFN